MGTSRARGISSSLAILKPEEIVEVCLALARGPRLSPIITALGKDASLHLVGGTVRDVACGVTAADIDLASRLLPQEALSRCVNAGLKVVETGLKHGTLTIVHEGEHIELTTFRHPSPHHHEHYATTIEEDLGGRDFTINALAVALDEPRLVDTYHGLSDLQAGVLRSVGDAVARILEDPHRIMRLIRFGPAEGRTVESESWQAAEQHCRLLENVSPERISAELRRILIAPHAREAVRAMWELGILREIAPELLMMVGVPQNEFHTEDVFDHSLSVLERCSPEATLRLVALFHDAGKPATISTGDDGRRHFYEHEVVSARIAEAVMTRLRFSNEEIHQVSLLVRHHMRPIECGAPGVRRILRDVAPYYDKWREFKYADSPPVMSESEVQQRLSAFDAMVEAERVRVEKQGSKLAISGNDLIAIGFPPGVQMGRFLKECEELVIEKPELNDRNVLLQRAEHVLKTS